MGYIFKHIREELLPLEAVYIFDRYGVINNRVFVLLQRSGFLSASFSFLRLLFPLCTRDALFAKFFFRLCLRWLLYPRFLVNLKLLKAKLFSANNSGFLG